YLTRGLVRLVSVAAAARAAHTKDREDHREYLARRAELDRLKTSRKVVHRAAVNGAVLVDIAVCYAQRTFDEFRRHTQQAGDDHPKRGARAADSDRDRHTRDVSEPDGSRHGRRQGLKVVDLAVMAFIFDSVRN